MPIPTSPYSSKPKRSTRSCCSIPALAVNAALLGLFAVQHSLMARRRFKRAWTRIVPAPVERSTYVLFSSLALLLLFWKWEPMGRVVWNVESGAGQVLLYALYAMGWLTVLVATFLISHFDLFGLRQVWLHLRGIPYTPLRSICLRAPTALGYRRSTPCMSEPGRITPMAPS